MTQVLDLSPADIRPSPHNHRRRFTGLDELGVSLLEKGMISPVTVRPTPNAKKSDEPYELVVGERRWRAATKVKLPSIPAIVRELGDKEVIEIQLVENVQRVDVHPMEEAEGYSELLSKHSYDVDQIVSKTGKSRTAVYNRLKLLKLTPASRKAFLDDKFNATIAEMIARIPTKEMQEQALAEILKGRHEDKWNLEGMVGDDDGSGVAPREGIQIATDEVMPLSTREAQLLLQRRYMLRLELAPFDMADPTLVKSAGACTTCVYRTGNQVELFADVASPDVCTNPPCFEGKKKADWARKAAAAKAEGQRVLSEEESDQVFQSDRLSWNAPYVDLKAEADYEFQPDKGKKKTWGQVLGKETPTIVLAKDDNGAAHELVDKKAAFESLKESGRLPKLAQDRASDRASGKASRKATQEKQKIREITAAFAIGEIAADQHDTLKEVLWLAECVIRQASMEAHIGTCNRRNIEPKKVGQYGGTRTPREKALLELAGEMKDKAELFGLIRELLAWESACALYQIGWGTNLAAGAKTFKVDMAKLHAKVVGDFKAAKAEKAKSKAAPKKKAS